MTLPIISKCIIRPFIFTTRNYFVNIGLGPFSFGMHRPEPVKLNKGESVLISYWRWWPPGWKQKLITLDSDRNVTAIEI